MSKPITFEIWGDSHMDDMAGIGARKAFEYLTHFRHDVEMLRNKAKAGSVVHDWISEWASQKTEDLADVIVVSSGFNEAVLIKWGTTTYQEVVNVWEFFMKIAEARGQKVLWVPTNYLFGRSYDEFFDTGDLAILPADLGADVLDWEVGDEDDLCPDRIHNSYTTSYYLADQILDKVSTYKKETYELLTVPASAERDS